MRKNACWCLGNKALFSWGVGTPVFPLCKEPWTFYFSTPCSTSFNYQGPGPRQDSRNPEIHNKLQNALLEQAQKNN